MTSRVSSYLLIILVSLVPTTRLYATTPTPTPTPATRTVKFAWKASSSDDVVGYKIYWGTGTYNYQNVLDVRNALTTSLTLSKSTKYYVAVSAYTMSTNSPFSNEVIVPPMSGSW